MNGLAMIAQIDFNKKPINYRAILLIILIIPLHPK